MFEDLPLYADIKEINANAPTQPHANFGTITIHTPTNDIETNLVSNIDIVDNYRNNNGREMYVSFKISSKDWVRHIYTFINNMEITINGIRYKALPIPDRIPHPKSLGLDRLGDTDLDNIGLLTVEFQLIDRSIEALRYKTIGGAYSSVKMNSFITSLLGHYGSEVVVDGDKAIRMLHMVDSDNKRTYKHIVIPDGMRLIDLVPYMQKEYGIYNSSLGFWIHNFVAYIYPVFNYKVKRSGVRYLRLIGVPGNDNLATDTSYYVTDKVLSIYGGGDWSLFNDAGGRDLEAGNGIRFPETASMMKKPVDISGTEVQGVRNRINTEALITDRGDGANVAVRKTTNNLLEAMSKVVENNTNILTFNWISSNPDLLEPGMTGELIYPEGNKTISVYFVLLSAQTSIVKGALPVTNLFLSVEKP